MAETNRPVALVTGAAGGLGGAIARALAGSGFASGTLRYATGQTIHVDGGMRFKSF